jgi:hypothetical protein
MILMSRSHKKEKIRNQIFELEKLHPKSPEEFDRREKKLDSLYAQLYQLNHPPQVRARKILEQ